MKHKAHYRVVIAITLVITIGASLWFSAPLPARAFGVSISAANSPISGTTTYLLGESISLPTHIEFDPLEFKNLQSVQLTLTGPEFPSPFTQDLPLSAGTYSYPANATADPAKPGLLDVVASWEPGISHAGGYLYGYGYGGYGSTAKIQYDIQWTPPYALTIQPSPAPRRLQHLATLAWRDPLLLRLFPE